MIILRQDKMEFKPFISIGDISFGETREQVRDLFNDNTEFTKNKYSKNTTDHFDNINVYYNKDNEVEAVECFNNNSNKIIYKNKDIFKLSKEELIKLFNDPRKKENKSTLEFKSFGIDVELDDDVVENIFVYSKNY